MSDDNAQQSDCDKYAKGVKSAPAMVIRWASDIKQTAKRMAITALRRGLASIARQGGMRTAAPRVDIVV